MRLGATGGASARVAPRVQKGGGQGVAPRTHARCLLPSAQVPQLGIMPANKTVANGNGRIRVTTTFGKRGGSWAGGCPGWRPETAGQTLLLFLRAGRKMKRENEGRPQKMDGWEKKDEKD